MPTFSPEELMDMTAEGGMETQFVPVPVGEWDAYIEKIETRSGTSEKGNDWTMLDVFWTITAGEVIQETEQDEPKVRQSIFLDFDDNGRLAMGKNKNIGLGRLRDALGQNGPGPWKFSDLVGGSAIVRVEHREYNGAVFSEVKAVSAR